MTSRKLFPKRRRRNRTLPVAAAILLPYLVGFTSDSSSSYSEILAGAGSGQYVYHDCSGAHTQTFVDAGITAVKKFDGPYRIGVSIGGWSAGNRGSSVLVFPDLALDWKYFSAGTTGIRVGSRQDIFAEARWLDQPPFWSGKGLLRAGIGGPVSNAGASLWLGLNVIPYHSAGLAAQYDFPLKEKSFVFFNGRIGSSDLREEFGFSVGMRFVND